MRIPFDGWSNYEDVGPGVILRHALVAAGNGLKSSIIEGIGRDGHERF